MHLLLSYVMYFLFLLLALLIFYVFLKINEKKAIKTVEKEKKRAGLYIPILNNLKKIEKLERSKSFDADNEIIHQYLSQNNLLLENFFELERLEFCKTKSKGKRFIADKMLEEFTKSKNIKLMTAIQDTTDVLDFLYKTKHPFAHKMKAIKKNILVQFLMTIVVLLLIKNKLFDKGTQKNRIKNENMASIAKNEINVNTNPRLVAQAA